MNGQNSAPTLARCRSTFTYQIELTMATAGTLIVLLRGGLLRSFIVYCRNEYRLLHHLSG